MSAMTGAEYLSVLAQTRDEFAANIERERAELAADIDRKLDDLSNTILSLFSLDVALNAIEFAEPITSRHQSFTITKPRRLGSFGDLINQIRMATRRNLKLGIR